LVVGCAVGLGNSICLIPNEMMSAVASYPQCRDQRQSNGTNVFTYRPAGISGITYTMSDNNRNDFFAEVGNIGELLHVRSRDYMVQ
jgi:hypothetical protein